jgi:hypothetical protein
MDIITFTILTVLGAFVFYRYGIFQKIRNNPEVQFIFSIKEVRFVAAFIACLTTLNFFAPTVLVVHEFNDFPNQFSVESNVKFDQKSYETFKFDIKHHNN